MSEYAPEPSQRLGNHSQPHTRLGLHLRQQHIPSRGRVLVQKRCDARVRVGADIGERALRICGGGSGIVGFNVGVEVVRGLGYREWRRGKRGWRARDRLLHRRRDCMGCGVVISGRGEVVRRNDGWCWCDCLSKIQVMLPE